MWARFQEAVRPNPDEECRLVLGRDLAGHLQQWGHDCQCDNIARLSTLSDDVATILIAPTRVETIQRVYRFCQAFSVAVAVVGGGHSDHFFAPTLLQPAPRAEGSEVPHDALSVQISMAHFREVKLVPEGAGLVRVGGGVRQGELAAVLDQAGLVLPLGSRPSVGVGLLLHGGVGHFAGVCPGMRLGCDAVVGATVVLPTGDVVVLDAVAEAQETAGDDVRLSSAGVVSRQDLWHSLRGAGSTLGCVVSLTLRTCAFPPGLRCTTTVVTPNGVAPSNPVHDYSRALLTPHTDLYVFAPGSDRPAFVTQSFDYSPSLPPPTPTDAAPRDHGAATQPALDDGPHSCNFSSGIVASFEAEYHGVLDRTGRYFLRSIFVDAVTADDATAVATSIESVMGLAPTKGCYLHAVALHRASSVAVEPLALRFPPSCLEHVTATATHSLNIIGQWDDAADEASARLWVLNAILLLRKTAQHAFVYGVDLGYTDPLDASLMPLVFPADTAARVLSTQIAVDPSGVVRSCVPLR